METLFALLSLLPQAILLARVKTGNLPKREFEFAKGQFYWKKFYKTLTLTSL